MRHRHSPQGAIHIFVAGNDDADDGGIPFANNFEQGGAVHFRHAQVGDDRVESRFGKLSKGRFGAGSEDGGPWVLLGGEHGPQRVENSLFVIHEKDSFHSVLLLLRRVGTPTKDEESRRCPTRSSSQSSSAARAGSHLKGNCFTERRTRYFEPIARTQVQRQL